MTQSKTQKRIQDKAAAALPLVVRHARKITGGLWTPLQLAQYRWEPERYLIEVLGWTPWRGTPEAPGQCDVIDAYLLALRQMHERESWENGQFAEEDLQYWKVGEVIQNRLRLEAGHTVGKTKLASGLFSHFFDCFTPAIVYSYAPGWEAIKDLLWKEIGTDREGKGLPGSILENCQIKYRKNHFAKGRAASNAGGKGTERIQGQHGKYLMFVLDEAEGVADFVYDAVDSMASGGICIVLMLANPKTRSSRFHKIRIRPDVKNFRISCLSHPNCIEGRQIIPGAVQRHYPVGMLVEHAQVVAEHSEDNHTFEFPWQPGVIYRPDAEYCFRILGIPPANMADNTLITVGRYEAACKRSAESPPPTEVVPVEEPSNPFDEDVGSGEGLSAADYLSAAERALLLGDAFREEQGEDAAEAGDDDFDPDDPDADIPQHRQVWGYLGCDVAGFGKDAGTLYRRLQVRGGVDTVRRAAQLWKQDYDDYARRIREEAVKLKAEGATHLSLRIDAGGGFGQGVLSHLKKDLAFLALFPGNRLRVHTVNFGVPARDTKAYGNCVTELYAQAGETLKGIRLDKPPDALEADLCERTYDWVNQSGVEVKKLEEKKAFKKRHEGRSPDDGDGFVLCVAPEFLFGKHKIKIH